MRRALFRLLLATLMVLPLSQAHAADAGEIQVYAAGSLRAALVEMAAAFEAAEPGRKVRLTLGASGLLKDRLVGGERADVFASANMEHPQALAEAGRAAPVQRFARNRLCALVAPGLDVTAATLIDRLLDPAIRVGTSTPKADPSGDYTWNLFENIERGGRSGAFKALSAKALQLTGGPQSPPPPADRNVYGALVAAGQADLFITYCTNAVIAVREVPALHWIEVPADINVSANYGVTLMRDAAPQAQRFVQFLMAPNGQAVLMRHGFAPP